MLTSSPPLTPANRGYRMPAEWEPHASTWLAWPHRRSDWPGKFRPIPWVYGEIVRALTQHERVNLLVGGPGARAQAEAILESVGVGRSRLGFWQIRTDRSWVRDSGPIFVVNDQGDRAVLDWRFNWQPRLRSWRVVLEGGSIDVNGQGLLLTTEECLLSKTQERNPPFDRADYEQVFADYLGVKKVCWLANGIAGDDTHGHVDDLARFVGPRTIVTVVEDDPADANYKPTQENLERLRGMTDLDGGQLEIVTLPMPSPLVFDGMRLPASYANFYIANDLVIVPTFNDPMDRVALGTLVDLFPGREVVGIHCVDLVWGLGTLHCMTQQEPSGGVV